MGLFSAQISTKKMVPLCRQLATSFDAGIPIIRTFDHVGGVSRDGKIRRVLTDMTDDLKRGTTLGEAANNQRKYLSPFFIQLLHSGERGGHLDVMLRDLAQYFEDRLAMQRMIGSMLAYPMFLFMVAWFFGTFAFGLLDVIREAVTGKGGGTQGVMAYIESYVAFQAKAMVVFAIIFAICVVLIRLGIFGWISGAFTTFIWPMSIVTRKFALARFFRSFSLLLGAGLSMPRCIESSAAITANPYIEKNLLKSIDEIKQGATLVQALETSRELTPLAREMLVVGEESGNLELQMRKISQFHLEEATDAVKLATRVLATMLFVGVSLLVLYILVTFYTTLYGGIMDEFGI